MQVRLPLPTMVLEMDEADRAEFHASANDITDLDSQQVDYILDLLIAEINNESGASAYLASKTLLALLAGQGLAWANPFNEENRKEIADSVRGLRLAPPP